MDNAKKWAALAAAIALVLALGGWSLLVQPQRDEAASLHEQADVQLEQNAHLQTQLEVLRGKAAGLSAQQADIAEVTSRIPPAVELPQLVRALTAAARGAGVELAALTPGAPVPVAEAGAGQAGTGTEPAEGAPAAGLTALPVTMQVTGDFYQLAQFVAALEDLPRAVRVTDLSLTDPEDSRGRVLQSTITASVYSGGPAAATEPAAAAPAGTEPPAVAGPAAESAPPAAVAGPPVS